MSIRVDAIKVADLLDRLYGDRAVQVCEAGRRYPDFWGLIVRNTGVPDREAETLLHVTRTVLRDRHDHPDPFRGFPR